MSIIALTEKVKTCHKFLLKFFYFFTQVFTSVSSDNSRLHQGFFQVGVNKLAQIQIVDNLSLYY